MAVFASNITRRGVVAGAAAVGLGFAGAQFAAGTSCAFASGEARATATTAGNDCTPTFLESPEAITDFAETKDFDVVVVGAGASGLAAAMRAAQTGAKVAVVQKLDFASTQGFEATGLLADDNDEPTKQAFVSKALALSEWRPKRELLDAWAHNSGDAIAWFRGILDEAGVEQEAEDACAYEKDCNGYTAKFLTCRPSATYAGAADGVATYAADKLGVEFFYGMPAVQLAVTDGAVTGVIAGTEGAYTLFSAAKGVVLATGDYQCNDEMIAFFCPDVLGFPPLEVGRDGDGHRMGVWAGGHLEPVGHTKMIHESWSNDAPFLMVNAKGERFCDEHIPWFKVNTLLRSTMKTRTDDHAPCELYSIADAKYQDQMTEWQAIDADIKIKDWPEMDPEAAYQFSWEADTLEELAGLMGVDADALQATVKRYNELVDAGADEDFGKDVRFMAKIDTPPFRAVMRDFVEGLSAMLGGLVVDADQRVLNADDEPITGLFAVGNVSGPFFGGIDYPMYFPGLSIGRALTTGYIAGAAVVQG